MAAATPAKDPHISQAQDSKPGANGSKSVYSAPLSQIGSSTNLQNGELQYFEFDNFTSPPPKAQHHRTGQKVAAKVMRLKMGIISFCIFAIINYVMNYHINNSLKYFRSCTNTTLEMPKQYGKCKWAARKRTGARERIRGSGAETEHLEE